MVCPLEKNRRRGGIESPKKERGINKLFRKGGEAGGVKGRVNRRVGPTAPLSRGGLLQCTLHIAENKWGKKV